MSRIIFAALLALGAQSTCAALSFMSEGSECDGALKTLSTISSSSQADSLRLGLSITRETWSKMQQNFKGDVTIPIGDIPVSIGSNYDAVQEAQTLMRYKYSLADDFSQQAMYVNQRIDESAYTAYRDCITKDKRGVFILLKSVEGDTIHGTWYFNSSLDDVVIRKAVLHFGDNAKNATDAPVTWPEVHATGQSDFTLIRTKPGNINVTIELQGTGGSKYKETAALRPIVEPPKLRTATYAYATPVVQDTEFNARYTRTIGVVHMCVNPTHDKGRIISLKTEITRYETTASVLGLETVSGVYDPVSPSAKTVCGDVGCRGYTYSDGSAQVSNCSGHGKATSVEQYISAWTDVK
ncbi:hypothetical protein [Scleromatobacter humisilvae]|uniref:Uncharacterized protein n=1 Tax=Scleromatobacter humisilvae TaxID=2897159 RepID=A0A9X1YKV8_9BURK|nr:hypothetical protein [Scleromatobacter humisilvae]MCK9687315.1 hypothetical protein [Scleromatobacter humisilvae]